MEAVLESKYYTQFVTRTLAELKGGVDTSAVKEKVKNNVSEDMEPFFPVEQ